MSHKSTEKLNAQVGKSVRLPCSTCSAETYHDVVASFDVEDADMRNSFWFDQSAQVMRCGGCRTLSFRYMCRDNEDWDVDEDEAIFYPWKSEIYPARTLLPTSIPVRGHSSIPDTVWTIYEETSLAIAARQLVLAGIGLRALVEAVCKEREAKGNNLEKQIDALADQRILTPAGAAVLHRIRYIGNYAAHEVKPHKQTQLVAAFGVVQHLLSEVYVLPGTLGEVDERKGTKSAATLQSSPPAPSPGTAG